MDGVPGDLTPPAAPAAGPDACYGVGCPRRGQCELYSAIGLRDGWVIGTCQAEPGEAWKWFRPHAGERFDP